MNTDYAKTIAITSILDKLNIKPVWETASEAMYLSPIRNEKTASFHVNKLKNLWFDFGLNAGGNIVDLTCRYLESQSESSTVADSLRWLKNMSSDVQYVPKICIKEFIEQDKKLKFISAKPLKHVLLFRYLESRGIAREVGSKYLNEVRVFNKSTNGYFKSLGLKNEESGFELRNPFLKALLAQKA